MLLYILKFSACLAALLIFYKLFLERESIHVFKRFYLLAALVFSLTVPALVFTEYVTINPGTDAVAQTITHSNNTINVPPALDADILDIAPLLWGVYFLGLIFSGIKFIKNLFQILRRIKTNPKEKVESHIRVLLLEKLHPHTFFKYIFLNKVKYESNEIPKEVLLHEETHAKQRHSLDVLFIEFLQILMWFNPLIYFIRKSIKLNHEFLADKAVLKKGIASSTYQNTLLSFTTPIHHQSLVNAINYSSIKKRFTVMKSKTSKKSVVLRTLLLLPLSALLLISFSAREIRYEASDIVSEKTDINASELKIEIRNNLSIWLNDTPLTMETLSDKVLEFVSPTTLTDTILINASPEIEVPDWLMTQLHQELGKLGITNIQIHTETAKINIYDDNKKPIVTPHEVVQDGATEKQLNSFSRLAKKYNAIPVANRKIPLKDLKTLETIYRVMTPLQKEHAEAFPECPPQNVTSQEGASRKLMAEYNKLAKHYNNLPDRKMKISLNDVERLRYIYSLMSEKQRADAEPFPNFPPMPDASAPPALPEIASVSEAAPSAAVSSSPAIATQAISPVKATLAAVPPSPAAPPAPELAAQSSVPPPPPPPDPLAEIVRLSKEDAIFYYRNKRITSDEAISIIKENTDLSISVKRKNDNPPVVKISKHL